MGWRITMLKITNILILLSILSVPAMAQAHNRENTDKFYPYLETPRHLQIPQWEDKNWYAEDWLSQKSGMDLVKGFYKADILRDQIAGKAEAPVLIVGPNFYRLSGYDKRRVATIIDKVYGITAQKVNGSFYLQDWRTKDKIGVYDQDGLRLH